MEKQKELLLECRNILTEVVLNGFHHIKCIHKEIKDLNITDPETASIEDQNKLRALTMTMTLVNDLIHPAHKLSKKLLGSSEHAFIDYCMKYQQVALTTKVVDECFCISCKEDKDQQDTSKQDKDEKEKTTVS